MNELSRAPSYAGSWRSLKAPLLPWVLDTIEHTLNFTQLTPVQASAIPLFLSHKDVIVEAVTGSGKTLAYLIPLIHILLRRESPLKRHQVGAIVLVPTRELAIQVSNVLNVFLQAQEGAAAKASDEEDNSEREGTKLIIPPPQLLVGGTKTTPQDDYTAFRTGSPHVLIGTPGRMSQLLQKRGVDKSELDLFVLDEADRLLDANFGPTLKEILATLPKQRRTGLFSATMTDALGELVKVGLRNPVRVVVKVAQKQQEPQNSRKGKEKAAGSKAKPDDTQRIPAGLQNFYHLSRAEHKLSQLLRILAYESGACSRPDADSVGTSHGGAFQPARKFIVYFATGAQVNFFYKLLSRLPELKSQHVQLFSLHGKQTPARRTATFNNFVSANPVPLPLYTNRSKKVTSSIKAASAVLLCTDVAARGLDLPDVDVVIQFDPPTDPKVFSHRCGRTARAGRGGRAIVMLVAAVSEPGLKSDSAGEETPEGQQGQSVGRKLGKGEQDYVEFMRIRKIPLQPYPYLRSDSRQNLLHPSPEPVRTQFPVLPSTVFQPADPEAFALSQQCRSLLLADRDLHELSLRAFVSFARAYSQHEASFIFGWKEVVGREVAAWCLGWGMIKVPRMPELDGFWDRSVTSTRRRVRKRKGSEEAGIEVREDDAQEGGAAQNRNDVGFEEINLDLRTYAYQDKAREKQRQDALAQRDQTEQELAAPKKPGSNLPVKVDTGDAEADAQSESELGSANSFPGCSEDDSDDEDEDGSSSSSSGGARRKKKKVKKEAWSNQKDRKSVRELRKAKKARKRAYLRKLDGEAGEEEQQQQQQQAGGRPIKGSLLAAVSGLAWAGSSSSSKKRSAGQDNEEEAEEEEDWDEDMREAKRDREEAVRRETEESNDFFSGL